MKIFRTVCLLALFGLAQPALAAEKEAEKAGSGVCEKQIATVYGENICEADITPDAEMLDQIRAYTTMNGEDPDKAIEGVRLTNLFGEIWEKTLINRYGEDKFKPTKKEIDSYIKAFRAGIEKQYEHDKEIAALIEKLVKENSYSQEHTAQLNRLGMQKKQATMMYEMRDKMPADMKAQIDQGERDVAETMVKSWKVKRLLFEEYGGRVVFQQAGLEPIDAFDKFFHDMRTSKDIVVQDKAYEDVYDAMENYLNEDFTYLPSESPEVRAYFESPNWLYESDVAEKAHEQIKEALISIPHDKVEPGAGEEAKKEDTKKEDTE